VHRNDISGNSAARGGGVAFSNTATELTNNVIAGNTAAEGGGGIDCYALTTSYYNNTIADNSTDVYGGGIYCYGAQPRLHNCILWGNTAPYGAQIALRSRTQPSLVRVNYSCVQGGQAEALVETNCILYWNAGNIEDDPLFTDAPNGDYHFEYDSPCVNAGDPASDYSLEPEPNGGRIDMGAYGNTPEAPVPKPELPGDVNGDCVVNILDLISVRNNLGRTPSGDDKRFDANDDGKINILDLIFVRNRIGERCA